MSFTITGINQEEYYLDMLGLEPLSFTVDSLSPRTITETLDGRDGEIHIETTYSPRTLKAYFKLKAKDPSEYLQFKNSVYKLFDGKTYFYISDNNEYWKRWKVKTASNFNVERVNPKTGKFELELVSYSPYCESSYTSLSPWETVSNHYFTENTFRVLNEGDITVDPRVHPLIIRYKGASTNLTIKNLTTGDEWKYSGVSSETDHIVLDGIRSFKNGISIFGDTNRKLISIASGINEFEVVGAVSPFEITFDYRYYYI